MRASPSIVLGYVDQLMSHLPDAQSPHAFISGTFRPGDQRTISLLASAGFSVDMQQRPIARLSPGQKARLGLLALRLTEPNFYLMDEPTNHVDIAGQERLEAEILAHEATCVIVSHDRAFVQAIAHAVPADRSRQDQRDRCAGAVLSNARRTRHFAHFGARRLTRAWATLPVPSAQQAREETP